MNGLTASLPEIEAMVKAVDAGEAGAAELAVCPPFTLIAAAAAKLKGGKVTLGGQDCSPHASGAYTGEISAPMLKDLGATYAIVGHSERRTYHHETDAEVRAKAEAALKAGLVAIVCVGETRAEREAGDAIAVVSRQVKGSLPPAAGPDTVVVAYEPVWAIGTGLTPTPADVAEVHKAIRALLGEPVRRVQAPRCASSMAARSSRPTPRNSSGSTTSTVRWSAARASRPPISWRSPRPIAESRGDSRHNGRAPCAVIGARHLF